MLEDFDLNTLVADPKNPRKISKEQFDKLQTTLKKFGDLSGIIKNIDTDQLVGGHMRIQAFRSDPNARVEITQRLETPSAAGTVALGYVKVGDEQYSYREVSWPIALQRAANVAANHAGGEDDSDLLAELIYELSEMENADELLSLTALRDDEIKKLLASVSGEDSDNEEHGNLSDDFIAPPFSILDTKQGYWQARKRSWLDLGIKSEEGRDDALLYGAANGRTDIVSQKIMSAGGGTSVFDPVLCEIAYRWFNVPNGVVLDPFAGGSVRGVIASKLGQQYVGLELRSEQVEANRIQAGEICADPIPVWVAGDSNKTLETVDGQADLLFSCPPYADLEVYSDDPDDLSNMPYPKFLEFYQSIINKACAKLKDDRFAVWVIGEVRGKDGNYYNFVGDTVTAFKNAGLNYYNEIILANSIGSLPLRAGKTFNAGRKIGKCHQNVLVFFKGNPQTIKANYGSLDFSQMEDMFAKEIGEAKAAEPLGAEEDSEKVDYLTN